MENPATGCPIMSIVEGVQDHAGPFGRENLEHSSRSAVLTPLFFIGAWLHGWWLPFGADLDRRF